MTTHAHDNDASTSTTHDNNDVVSSIYAMSYPALTGGVVTQGHTNYCASRGHATHTVEGVVQGTCPRCGAGTATRAQGTPSTSTDVEAASDPIVWVCTDCMILDVNHDTSGLSDERVSELWTTYSGWAVYVGDEGTDLDFSTTPCVACGTHLAGARHAYAPSV